VRARKSCTEEPRWSCSLSGLWQSAAVCVDHSGDEGARTSPTTPPIAAMNVVEIRFPQRLHSGNPRPRSWIPSCAVKSTCGTVGPNGRNRCWPRDSPRVARPNRRFAGPQVGHLRRTLRNLPLRWSGSRSPDRDRLLGDHHRFDHHAPGALRSDCGRTSAARFERERAQFWWASRLNPAWAGGQSSVIVRASRYAAAAETRSPACSYPSPRVSRRSMHRPRRASRRSST
jgi:hypothetical protein